MELEVFQFMRGSKLSFSFLITTVLHSLVFYSPGYNSQSDQSYKVQFKYSDSSLIPTQSQSTKAGNTKKKSNSSTSGVIQSSRPRSEISPVYPELSRVYKEEGNVIVLVQLNESGILITATIKVSSGYDRLDNSALTAVKSASFVPRQEGSLTASSSLELEFNFQLD